MEIVGSILFLILLQIILRLIVLSFAIIGFGTVHTHESSEKENMYDTRRRILLIISIVLFSLKSIQNTFIITDG